MRLRPAVPKRHGTTLVESSIVLLVFLTFVFGMLDLGLATFRTHLLSQAARHGARQAIVHGSMSPSTFGIWGPTAVTGSGSSTGVPLVDAVKPYLIGFDLNQTQISAQWLDGGNDPGQRVQVTVTTVYQPMITFLFGQQSWTLRSVSIMPIAH